MHMIFSSPHEYSIFRYFSESSTPLASTKQLTAERAKKPAISAVFLIFHGLLILLVAPLYAPFRAFIAHENAHRFVVKITAPLVKKGG